MVNDFIFIEIFLFLAPPLSIYLIRKYFKNHLKYFKSFPLNEAMILTPLWISLIHSFSLLIFDYSLVSFIVVFIALALGFHLYFHIQEISVFSLKKYAYPASKIIFTFLSFFLLSLIILRIYTYFR